MKILQICSARSIGGGENSLIDLSNSLADLGFDIYVAIAPSSPLMGKLNKLPKANLLECNLRNALDIKSAWQLAKFAKEKNIELLHAHLGRDYPLAALASKITNIPFVLTRHVVFPLKTVNKFLLKNVQAIIAPSNAVATALKEQNLFPAEKIKTIHYGIDLAHFSTKPLKNPEKNKKFTVGTIGNLDPVKGHDIFLRSARIVLDKFPGTRFVIVGEDRSKSFKNRREIENLLTELDLEDAVELAGWTDDVRPFFEKFDLYISASRSESFGLSIIEAMLAELPVISTATDGGKEITENGEFGSIVPIEDFQKLAEEILNLRKKTRLRIELGKKGKKHVEENFSLERMVKKTIEFYQDVLNSAKE